VLGSVSPNAVASDLGMTNSSGVFAPSTGWGIAAGKTPPGTTTKGSDRSVRFVNLTVATTMTFPGGASIAVPPIPDESSVVNIDRAETPGACRDASNWYPPASVNGVGLLTAWVGSGTVLVGAGATDVVGPGAPAACLEDPQAPRTAVTTASANTARVNR
jgi:hypothetical protein